MKVKEIPKRKTHKKKRLGQIKSSARQQQQQQINPLEMPPKLCEVCNQERAVIKRPKNLMLLCKQCFYNAFEEEVHETIISNKLFTRGERVAIAASGGKGIHPVSILLLLLHHSFLSYS